ncbi:MAG: heme exporter protein CcmD [Alcanivoracaceae bacterium]
MYFESFEAFLQMGRHGAYVWSAYGLSLLLIVASLVSAVREERAARQTVRRLRQRANNAGENAK